MNAAYVTALAAFCCSANPVRTLDGLEISRGLKNLHRFSLSLKPGPLKSFVQYDGAKSEPRSRNSRTRNRH